MQPFFHSLALFLALATTSAFALQPTREIPLNGPWQVTLAGEDQPRLITVPSSLEDALQLNYDGLSTWERTVEPVSLEPNQRLLIQFDAIATHAQVFFQGEPVGEHLGGWTAFEFDLTDIARRHAGAKEWKLRVEVDERVGHNTQGFLPIITHHFGGIWQPVRLRVVNEARIDTINLHVQGIREPGGEANASSSILVVDVPVVGEAVRFAGARIELAIREWMAETEPRAERSWQNLGVIASSSDGTDAKPVILRGETRIPVPDAMAWSPDSPSLYEVRVRLLATDETGNPDSTVALDEAIRRTGFSTVRAEGRKLLLNDEQLIVRGLLNWGYAPPLIAPSLDEKWMRDEIEFAKERGFNLMKFCLWVPPKRYLELCDEMGLLAWVEYPTWHPQLDQAHRDQLLAEYREFFAHDRNHPCVALRSLTCETGPSADLEVIRDLYNLGKTMVPSAMIEDDSSWIGWNRIHDFYDDHPYGNNHTWRETLARLNAYVDEHGAKPLVLGEAIAADTWMNSNPWLFKNEFLRSAHEQLSVEANSRWSKKMKEVADRAGLDFDMHRLAEHSREYAATMRQFQIDLYRREVPEGGFVVSVIRDFPKAGMGLIDYANEPKDKTVAVGSFARPALLLSTPGDSRSVQAGEKLEATILFAGIPSEKLLENGHGCVVLHSEKDEWWRREAVRGTLIPADQTTGWMGMKFASEVTCDFTVPTPYSVIAVVKTTYGSEERPWRLWAVPRSEWPISGLTISEPVRKRDESMFPADVPASELSGSEESVWLVDTLDRKVLQFVANGSNVMLLNQGKPGSFEVENHWFLRGGPVWFGERQLTDGNDSSIDSREEEWIGKCVTELQHLDLAGPVIPRIDAWLDRIEPRLLLWDNHDLAECRTHGLWFSMVVGDKGGRLMVSALNHFGEHNAVGEWLLKKMAHELTEERVLTPEDKQLGLDNLALLERGLFRREIQLVNEKWEFRPDPDGSGVAADGESLPGTEMAPNPAWQPIRIGEHWEGQGHAALDGWGWYRTRVAIPESWPAEKAQLVFTGVDDCCLVYVNGEWAGKCGDAETRESAFDLRTSIDIGSRIKPGATVDLVIAVYDWQGAGGLFRPITLATEPPDELTQLIVPVEE